jgi:hypothetical protein
MITWYQGHLTHVLVSSIFAIATVSLTLLEVFFVKNISSAMFFSLILQNVGIMGTSGYFASKISITAKGLTETNKGA